ncbi:MAG: hypothetical protein H6709_22920 [Kofleriaceae bacterium]|nr:hypothetical protein [Kofleriaceae bacterium]
MAAVTVLESWMPATVQGRPRVLRLGVAAAPPSREHGAAAARLVALATAPAHAGPRRAPRGPRCSRWPPPTAPTWSRR